MTTTSRCLALLVAILSFALPVIAQPQSKPDAKEIMDRMFKAYLGFASYQDEGILITTTDEPTGGTIEKMPFKTFFKRPNLFRFEWTDYGITKLGTTKIIWSNGKEAFSYWEPDYYEKKESLGLAVAGATGITSLTVNTIYDLLLPEEFSRSRFKPMVNLSLAGEEEFEGVSCYRIKATGDNERYELLIGKTDFLLRKLRRESKSDDTSWVYEEIRRKIQVDQSIAEVVFNYKPPIPLTPRENKNTTDIDKILNPGPPLWTEFKSEEGKFSILMPQKPISQKATVETGRGTVEQHIFIAIHDGVLCMVGYSDVPNLAGLPDNPDPLFDGLQEEYLKGLGGKLDSASALTLDGHRGREVKAQMYRGQLRLRMFLVGTRLYYMSLINGDKDAALVEESFNKFFKSFKLTSVPKPIALRNVNQARKTRLSRVLPAVRVFILKSEARVRIPVLTT